MNLITEEYPLLFIIKYILDIMTKLVRCGINFYADVDNKKR